MPPGEIVQTDYTLVIYRLGRHQEDTQMLVLAPITTCSTSVVNGAGKEEKLA